MLDSNVGIFADMLNIFQGVYNSSFFIFIKIFLIVYTLVLFIDLFLLLYFKGIGSDMQKSLTGTTMPVISKSKMNKKWEQVTQRLKSGNVSQYKVAILEADAIVDDILEKIGHEGDNMTERLEQMRPGQLEYQEELIAVHKVRNRIIHDENFVVDEDLARKTVAIYEKFLRYLEFM